MEILVYVLSIFKLSSRNAELIHIATVVCYVEIKF